MQVRQFISFLVAAAAVASAFECTFSNGNTLPDFVLEDFNEYSRIASKIGSNVALEMMYNSSLVKRQAKKMICTDGEMCIAMRGDLGCYDEKTTTLRANGDFTYVLKTGDMTMPDGTKGNVYNNIEPIIEFSRKEIRKAYQNMSGQQPKTFESSIFALTVSSGGSASTVENNAPTRSVTTPTVAATGAVSSVSTAASSAASSAATRSAGDDNEDSAAGMLIGSGWFAVAAAFAAVIVA